MSLTKDEVLFYALIFSGCVCVLACCILFLVTVFKLRSKDTPKSVFKLSIEAMYKRLAGQGINSSELLDFSISLQNNLLTILILKDMSRSERQQQLILSIEKENYELTSTIFNVTEASELDCYAHLLYSKSLISSVRIDKLNVSGEVGSLLFKYSILRKIVDNKLKSEDLEEVCLRQNWKEIICYAKLLGVYYWFKDSSYKDQYRMIREYSIKKEHRYKHDVDRVTFIASLEGKASMKDIKNWIEKSKELY